MTIQPIDLATFGVVIVTLSLGVFNLIMGQRIARRTSIVEAVTTQRLKWGEEIQDLIGSFCGAACFLRFSVAKSSDEERQVIETIGRLRHRIPLNLCQHKENRFERKIEECVKTITDMSLGYSAVSDEVFRDQLAMLVSLTQDLLRDNWISIADEAGRGVYTPRLGGEAQDTATDSSRSRI